MSEFKVIETQEQLNAVIGERLERERKSVEKQYEGYMSPEDVQEKYSGYLSEEDINKKFEGFVSPEELQRQLDEKDTKIKGYELDSVKTRVALTNGLPFEAISRISGNTEEEIQADVDAFKKIMGISAPKAKTEPAGDNKKAAKSAAYKNMLSGIKGE